MGGGVRLGVRVLGPLALDGLDVASLRSRKARRVLARLALAQGAPVSGETLIEAVWSDDPPSDPARDLAVLVSRARALVGGERLVRRPGGYALLADWWDRAECEALVRSSARRRDAGDLAGARAAVQAALGLVRGPLLSDEPDLPWAEVARAGTASLLAEARRIAAETALVAGQFAEAAAQARTTLDHDPYDEVAVRLLMRAQALAGSPATALATYAQVAARLDDDLGVDPAAETRELHERILRGELVERSGSPAVGSVDTDTDENEAPFVGRTAELARLDAALAASNTAGRVLVVVGEPGAGKSALLDHWARLARARGATVLTARAEDQGLALQPVLDALAGQLTTGVPASVDSAAGLPGPVASADALQLRMFDEIGTRLRSIVADLGLALIIDDLHCADPQTLAWLGHLLRRAASHRLLVIGATNDPALALPAEAERLPLPPLALEDVRVLVGPARAAEVYARAGGNALLVTELGRSGDDLPPTVRAAVAHRLAAAGDSAGTLRTAAVIGPSIDLDLLAAVLDVSPLSVLDHLDEGVRRGFLIEREASLEFRHELVRAAVAADTNAVRRTWIHQQAARLVTARSGAAGSPVELIRHARLGGDVAGLVTALVAASELARERLDLAGAEALLSEAIAAQDVVDLRLRRARIRMARGDLDGADEDAWAAMRGDTSGQALELRAWVARNRHDTDTAIRLGSAGAAVATEPATRASCLVAVAFAHRGVGDLRAADSLLSEAVELHPSPSMGLSAWIGVLRVHQGRPADALALLEPLLGADVDRSLQGYWVEHTLQMTAHAYGLIGRPVEALAVLERLEVELNRRGTSVRYAGATDTYRSWILRNLGAPGATDLARSGLERGGSTEIRAQCHLDLADGLLRDGALDSAAAQLAEAGRMAQARWFNNRWRFDQRLDVLRARLGLAADDPDGAAEPAQRVRDGAEQRGDRRYRAIGTVLLGTALARAGRSYDQADVRAQLAVLPEVAAIEAWWLAADLADATDSAEVRANATRWVDRLLVDAGEHGERLRIAARRRLG